MRSAIINGITENKELLELREELVKFKASGGTQEEAEKILLEIGIAFQHDEAREDKVLELLDFVVGWCQERFKVW